MTTANAAYTELTKREVLILIYFENEVKQLVQNVTKRMLSSIVKNEIKMSKRREKSESLRYVEFMRTNANTVISPKVTY